MPDDTLGLVFPRCLTSGQLTEDVSSLPILHSPSSIGSTLNVPLINKCISKCLRYCNQLTWFRFRCLMPCAITSLVYRLTITDDDVVQVFCSGVIISAPHEEALLGNTLSSSLPRSEGRKACVGNARRGLFTRPKVLRSIPGLELKPTVQISGGKNSESQVVKNYNKKTKWWKSFSRSAAVEHSVCVYYTRLSKSALFLDVQPHRIFRLSDLSNPLGGLCEHGRGEKIHIYAFTLSLQKRNNRVFGQLQLLLCSGNN